MMVGFSLITRKQYLVHLCQKIHVLFCSSSLGFLFYSGDGTQRFGLFTLPLVPLKKPGVSFLQ